MKQSITDYVSIHEFDEGCACQPLLCVFVDVRFKRNQTFCEDSYLNKDPAGISFFSWTDNSVLCLKYFFCLFWKIRLQYPVLFRCKIKVTYFQRTFGICKHWFLYALSSNLESHCLNPLSLDASLAQFSFFQVTESLPYHEDDITVPRHN